MTARLQHQEIWIYIFPLFLNTCDILSNTSNTSNNNNETLL